jgi:glucokinase
MSDKIRSDQKSLQPVVGVDLGGTQVRVAVMRGSNLLSRTSFLTGNTSTPSVILSEIFNAIDLTLQEAGVPLEMLGGIGIGVPGPVDAYSGTIFMLPNLPGWDNVPLRNILEQHFSEKTRIFIENDANVAGLGEYLFGAGRGYHNLVYLTISTGIGSCVIIDGKILRGATGTAGELGHMTIDWQGEVCNCGNIGCLESISSGTAIARRANAEIAAGHGNDLVDFMRSIHNQSYDSPEIALKSQINTQIVAQAAQAGVPLAQEIIIRATRGLGIGVINIIHSFNPQIIIFGGGVTQMGRALMEPVLNVVQKHAMKVPQEATRIVQAELGANEGLIGAGALVYHQIEQKIENLF